MRLSSTLFTLCLLLMAGLALGQSKISGTITDAESGAPLAGASVQIAGTSTGAITDATGFYRLDVKSANAIIRIQYLGYETVAERISPGKQTVYDFALKPQGITIETTTITDQKVERLYPKKQTLVVDYEFLKDEILVIIYDPERKRNVLQLLSPNFSILAEYDDPREPPRALFRDCLGATHAISEHFAGQVDHGPGNMLIVRNDSLHLFKQFVEPCQANIDSIYYYAEQPSDYVKQFTFRQKTDHRVRTLYTCVDKALMERYRDEMAMAEVDAGSYLDPIRAKYHMGLDKAYLDAVIAPPIYVPMGVIAGQICVFDHPHARILRFDLHGQIVDFTPIVYHLEREWRKEIIFNLEQTEAFSVSEKEGYFTVHRIDMGTGKLTEQWELPYPFVQKIRIRGNYIYFSFRDNREDQIKRIYRIAMD